MAKGQPEWMDFYGGILVGGEWRLPLGSKQNALEAMRMLQENTTVRLEIVPSETCEWYDIREAK